MARYFGLPTGVDADKISAFFKNGVLTALYPRQQQRAEVRRSPSRRNEPPDCAIR